MIFQIRTLIWIMQLLFEVIQQNLTNAKVKHVMLKSNSTLALKSVFMQKLILRPHVRVKRRPGIPYPHYPGEYANPPGYNYGKRPYPPSYKDYMLENERRLNSLQKYQSLGFLTNKQIAHMITQTFSDFFFASSLGQQWGGQPLDAYPPRPIRWLKNTIQGYYKNDWEPTEEPWRPPQWRPPEW